MGQATCEACGEANPLKSEFCAACGGYLGWQDDEPAAAMAQAEPTETQPPPVTGTAASTQTAAATPETPTTSAATGILPAYDAPRTAAPDPVTPRPSALAEGATPGAGLSCPSPTCGRPNTPDRRFCAKCGTALGTTTPRTVRLPSMPVAATGWRKILPSRTQDTLAARQAYRRSLPMRYRVTRVIAGLAALVLAAGLLAIAGHNPVRWATERWYAVRGTLTAVEDVTATVAPKEVLNRDYPPEHAVDGPLDTAWATSWGGGGATDPACGAPIPEGGRTPLTLTLPKRTTIRGVEVASGLPATDPQRVLQWRPVLLRLTFDDGSCQQVKLPDSAGLKRHRLRAVATATVRVDIARAAPPRSGDRTDASLRDVSLGEIVLLRRPG